MSVMKGVILAAGKGTRLYPLTLRVPKPLLPIANRVTLEYAFDRLQEIGVEDVCIVVGENEPVMKAALGDGHRFGLRLEYVRQTEPKGLAHALSFAKTFVGDDAFAMYLGDAIYGIDFKAQRDQFEASGCANLNLLKPVPDPSRFGVATVEGDRIVKLVEKPKEPESNLAMAGLYFFRREIWDVLPGLQPSARGEYEISDAIQALIDGGHQVLGSVYEGEWFDTGTLASYLETTAFLTRDRSTVAPGGTVKGVVGAGVAIGFGANVDCTSIEASAVMPGARVRVTGSIRQCILAGDVEHDGDLSETIIDGTSPL